MSYNNTTCAPERKQRPAVSIAFMMLGVLFCVCLIAANLLETKQIAFGPIDLTAGLIVFPVSYIINDCMVEVWGYRRARLVIWLGFAMNFLFVLFGMLADWLPGAPYWHGEEGFHAIFGLAPRICAASFVAFLVGSFFERLCHEPHETALRWRQAFFVSCHSLHSCGRNRRLFGIFPSCPRRCSALASHSPANA